MLTRSIHEAVHDALGRQAAVALLGPRQVGKTTLALHLAEEMAALYLDLEAPQDLAKLTEPKLFLQQYADRLVIMDEIHRVPELFQVLRGLIDKGRRQGLRTARFLMLGSASMDLMRQSGETLAGRIAYVEMTPLNVLEVDAQTHTQLWLRGGFPDSFLATSDSHSYQWRSDFIRTYLERDVPLLGPRIAAATLRRLWTMLAHHQAGLLNASRLAASLAISAPTVSHYVDLLVDLLLVRRLPPYHGNVGKRLVKSPKVYVRDSGIVHGLLGLVDYEGLAGHPVMGASFEGFVIEQLLNAAPAHTDASFYRTAAGAEIDLLLDFPSGERWAVEVKHSLTPKPTKGFHGACEDLQVNRRFVVYAGTARYPISHHVEAIGIHELMGMLRDKT